MKTIEIIKNAVGGVDLLTERDAGNTIRILTGKPSYSISFWQRLKVVCDVALDELGEE